MIQKPSFLIIGAMKAGTTTLYEDLVHLPGIYMPPDKEPEDLIDPAVETPDGLARYLAKFEGATAGALCGEASTAYSKRPTYEGVAPRAKRVLGENLKIIYMTRHPVKRLVSQYHHQWGMGFENRPMREALVESPEYLSYSRYDWQLSPWRETFPNSQILVVRFEDYLADRPAVLSKICAFLGVAAPAQGPDGSHRNKSEGKRYIPRGGMMERISRSRLYLYGVKPLLSSKIRDRVKGIILPKTRKLEEKLDVKTELLITKALENDALAMVYLAPPTTRQ
ncbi:sulfotransferase [Pseudooceanicola sp. HF7]|uniref:sulfotransferase family protein n=1 Tax=Pseudooceanicola sp. HF7 TaxID=2721560 RepID=UPI001430703C|nr:sulfotransferase [Pseudooceanicola sp. HF7]NIZ10950.1 sulfotransferase domain-containing protein [Pseudooceanicola sp. HF7]